MDPSLNLFMISFGRVDLVNGCMANQHPHHKEKGPNSFALEG